MGHFDPGDGQFSLIHAYAKGGNTEALRWPLGKGIFSLLTCQIYLQYIARSRITRETSSI